MFISEIDRIIKEVNGSMAVEGKPLTDEDRERICVCFLTAKNIKRY